MAKQNQKRQSKNEDSLKAGIVYLNSNALFRLLDKDLNISDRNMLGKNSYGCVYSDGKVYLNKDVYMEPREWAYVIAHCILHLAFGHFDAEHMPGYYVETQGGCHVWKVQCNKNIWNTACDIYIAKFLHDIKFGKPVHENPVLYFPIALNDERKIYQYLMENNYPEGDIRFSTLASGRLDMIGLDKPLEYSGSRQNRYISQFAYALAYSVSDAVSKAGGHNQENAPNTPARRAAAWFIDHYPLLGGIAAHFKIIEDYQYCNKNEISIAAISVVDAEIYINPSVRYSEEEWRFVLAHEYLHAGLAHQERAQGRDHYLWNVACDFVINGWLHDMQIGLMPASGLLYDEKLCNLSAEAVYDEIIANLRRYSNLDTFRGYGKGDIMGGPAKGKIAGSTTSIDEFCKSALQQGLEFHQSQGRGLIPAGLIEEIRALAMPPVPWDVKLANWFDLYFDPLEKYRSYARPSRRQASTPDIPRPRYQTNEILTDGRTFGVVIDTSGSMDTKMIGKALGAVASYSAAHDVPFARVVFCDAQAYDAGYLSPDDIAGRVCVQGRGGTILQPGIDLLEQSCDFPKDGPVLIITDGMIEEHIVIKHEHAWLLPAGNRLPFHTKASIFYFR
ncbi:MAG: hypothetical protein K2N73_12900 [Lachnospiraceae bacterium]|nr:hypothetical protein [Lachnospiraceae bacterium]